MYHLDCVALLIALCDPRAPPLMGWKSLFPGNKNPALKRVPFNALGRCLTRMVKSVWKCTFRTLELKPQLPLLLVCDPVVFDYVVNTAELFLAEQEMATARICKAYLYFKDRLKASYLPCGLTGMAVSEVSVAFLSVGLTSCAAFCSGSIPCTWVLPSWHTHVPL